MNTLAKKIEALAVDVSFTGEAPHVVLSDGRDLGALTVVPALIESNFRTTFKKVSSSDLNQILSLC